MVSIKCSLVIGVYFNNLDHTAEPRLLGAVSNSQKVSKETSFCKFVVFLERLRLNTFYEP